jgi:hypothetical protein
MDNKTLGIRILKSTALFTGKAAWFLLCKACLAVLLIMGFIVKAITSRNEEDESNESHADLGDPSNPSSPYYSSTGLPPDSTIL